MRWLLAVVLASCARPAPAGPEAARLAAARTFAIAGGEPPQGFRSTPGTVSVLAIAGETAAEILGARGYRAVGQPPADLVVRVTAGVRATGADAEARLDALNGETALYEPSAPLSYVEGTLRVEVFDAGRRLLWQRSTVELVDLDDLLGRLEVPDLGSRRLDVEPARDELGAHCAVDDDRSI